MTVEEKIRKLKSKEGYDGFKAVRITGKWKEFEVCVKNGTHQAITLTGKNQKEVYTRVIELIEEVNHHENI